MLIVSIFAFTLTHLEYQLKTYTTMNRKHSKQQYGARTKNTILLISLFFIGKMVLAQNEDYRYPSWAFKALNSEGTEQIGFGMIDITKPPFNADPTGVVDASNAIQEAINRYLGTTETIFFPEGTYKISKTIEWQQYRDINNPAEGTRAKSRLVLQGQGMYKTVIKLIDNALGFNSPANPKPVIITEGDNGIGNQAFENFLKNMTIDVGTGNSGAIAIHYRGCNMTGMEYMRFKSSDPNGAGYCGVYLWDKETGVGYFRHIEIDGFQYGIICNEKWKEVGFEQIKMRNQTVAGVLNNRHPLSMNEVDFEGNVPFMIQNSANPVTVLLNATLKNTGGSSINAIFNNTDAKLLVRNTTFIGYDTAIVNHAAQPSYTGNAIGNLEWVSHARLRNHECNDTTSLNLPILQAPEFHTNDFSKWANVLDYGVIPNDTASDLSIALQAAIDSGAEYINVPKAVYSIASTVKIRNNVRKINFNYARMSTVSPFFVSAAEDNVWLEFNNTTHGCVIIENLDYSKLRFQGPAQERAFSILPFKHQTSDTLVFRHHLGGLPDEEASLYVAASGAGPFFLEEGNLGGLEFAPNQKVYIRGNDGIEHPKYGRYLANTTDLWIFASSQESGGIGINAQNSSRVEALGYSIYRRRGGVENNAVFDINNSSLSATFAESEAFPGDTPYNIYVKDDQGGQVKLLYSKASYFRVDVNYDGSAPLFTSYEGCSDLPTSPLAPTNLSAGNPFFFRNTLKWENNADNDEGMLLQRKISGGAWMDLATLFRNTTSYIDEPVEPQTTYEYRVRTFNSVGSSDWSNVVAIETKALSENLKAHYTFEDNANDQTINGNDGVLFGGANFVTDAKEGNKALKLNGIDAFVRLGNEAGTGIFHQAGNARTITMWIKAQQVEEGLVQYIYEQGSNINGLGWRFTFNDLNRLSPQGNQFNRQMTAVAMNNGARSEIRTVGYRSDDWRHIALVYDGTSGRGALSFYVDGKLQEMDNPGGTRSDFKASPEFGALGAKYITEAHNFGAPAPNGTNFFKGLMDDVKVFNAPLPEQLIQVMAGNNFTQSIPDEVNDLYSVKSNNLTVSAPSKGVIANDKDMDGNSITAELVSNPNNGVLDFFNANGTFRYVPNSGYQGIDTFTYRIFNGINYSDEAIVALVVGETNAPSAPTLTPLSSTAIAITWTDNSNNETSFDIERQGPNQTTFTKIATVGANTTTYNDLTVSVCQTYSYRISACNINGCSIGASNSTTSLCVIPNAPSNLLITNAGCDQIALAWNDNASDEAGYIVERSSGSSFFIIDTLSANTVIYINTGLTESTNYAFRVYAYNVAGVSATSNTVAATTILCAPSVPRRLRINNSSNTTIDLGWNTSTNATGYVLERKVDGEIDFSLLANIPPGTTTFQDNTLNPCTFYSYRIRAFNSSASSQSSNVAAITTQGCTNNTTTVLNPTDDAYIFKNDKNTNFGNSTLLEIRGKGTDNSVFERIAFVKFDLATVTENLNSAKLRMKVCVQSNANSALTSIHTMNDANDGWLESVITWNNPPQTTLGTPINSIIVNGANQDWFEWDITGLVKEELDNRNQILGITIYTEDPSLFRFCASEIAEYKPELVLNLNTGAINLPPAVLITAPTDGTIFNEGNNIVISANASDVDGTISKVEFFANGTKLGEDTNAPYNFTWITPNLGSYNLTAVAIDNNGATATSDVIDIAVNPTPQSDTLNVTQRNGQSNINNQGVKVQINLNGWIVFYNVNLTGYTHIISTIAANGTNRKIEFRLGSPTGTIISQLNITPTGGWDVFSNQSSAITNNPGGIHDLYVVGLGGTPVCKLTKIILLNNGGNSINPNILLNDAAKNIIKVYPNPTDLGILNIKGLSEGALVEIYSIIGKKVLSKIAAFSEVLSLDIHSLQKGVFQLIIHDKDNIFNEKIIVQ